jgi:cellulose synthase/poly-beta-1,6-N-acetylglucosamine synthase-like glycosyltransferase
MREMLTAVVAAGLAALALPAALSCLYLFGLTLLAGALPPVPRAPRRLRFDVIVPAHNEAAGIVRTVASLRAIDWPQDCFRVIVVADHCSDTTAELARAAGAEVWERSGDPNRGKGYVLKYAFARSRDDARADAVCVVDADATVSANFLEAIAARIERGANAVQVHYGILNPLASWRTRLITIAKAAFHIVRSRARERLGLSCGIRGNGWCVTHALLREVPYRCFSVTEDIEFGIALGLAGYRVHYADEAHADAEMVSGAQAAARQRQRWEAGRFHLVRNRSMPLLAAALSRRSAVCFDLAFDLLLPPLSYVVLNLIGWLVAAGLSAWFLPPLLPFWRAALLCCALLALHVLRGWQLSGLGLRGLVDLLHVPGFLIWKTVLMLRRGAPQEWVRTERESR